MDCNLERFQATFFAELFLHELDVRSQTALAMPFETTFFACLFFSVLVNGTTFLVRHKDSRWLCLDVEHHELFPVEMQIEWRLFRVNGCIFHRDV